MLIELIEHLKKGKQNLHSLPAEPISVQNLGEPVRWKHATCLKQEAVPKNSGYAWHSVFEISWDTPLYIRLVQFATGGKVLVRGNGIPSVPSNALTKDSPQTRLVIVERFCDKLTLDVYSQQPTSLDELQLQIYLRSLLYRKPTTASSCWPIESELYSPSKAVDCSELYWNAHPNFTQPEYLEVDLEEIHPINRILLLERDAHRIRKYMITGTDETGREILCLSYVGVLSDEPQVHDFPPVAVRKLRLTILKTEMDALGFTEPGIKRFEAYYYPPDLTAISPDAVKPMN